MYHIRSAAVRTYARRFATIAGCRCAHASRSTLGHLAVQIGVQLQLHRCTKYFTVVQVHTCFNARVSASPSRPLFFLFGLVNSAWRRMVQTFKGLQTIPPRYRVGSQKCPPATFPARWRAKMEKSRLDLKMAQAHAGIWPGLS